MSIQPRFDAHDKQPNFEGFSASKMDAPLEKRALSDMSYHQAMSDSASGESMGAGE